MRGFNPRWIEGKTIKSVDMRPRDSGRKFKAFNPIIRFDDGSMIGFDVQETEDLAYGIAIIYMRAP